MPEYSIYATKKKELFKRLRGELVANGLNNSDLSRLLNKGTDYVSRCLNWKAQFTLAEQYIILKAINRPASEMHIIFPEGGVQVEESKQSDHIADVATSKFTNRGKTQLTREKPDSAANQILHATAEILRLQADLLDALALANLQKNQRSNMQFERMT